LGKVKVLAIIGKGFSNDIVYLC